MRRFVLVLGMGACLLAGCGGQEAKDPGRSTLWGDGSLLDPPLAADAPDSVRKMQTILAWVGERPVTAWDVYRHMQSTNSPENAKRYMANADILQVALNALVDQLVWGEIAKDAGYTFTPAERREVQTTEALLLATRYVADVVEKEALPSDEEVEAYYREHQTNYLSPPRVAVRHILVRTEAEARALHEQIQGGADFVALARTHSLDADSKTLGGALGYLAEGGELPGIGHSSEIENTLLPMKEGQTAVVQSRLGWHVMRVDKREEEFLVPLAEVRQSIVSRLINNRFSVVYNQHLTAARDQANVRIEEGAFEEFTGVAQNAARLLALAKEHPDSGGRIALLRRLPHDLAASPEAPEAQFLIAYEFLVHAKQPALAEKGLVRLKTRYPDSKWVPAADYLLAHLNDPPRSIGTVDEVLERAGVSPR